MWATIRKNKLAMTGVIFGLLFAVVFGYQNCGGPTNNNNNGLNGGLMISPSSTSLGLGASLQFSASGGTPPYSFYISSGGGTINPSTGFFTAPSTASYVTVSVRDNSGLTANAYVTVGSGSGGGGGGGGGGTCAGTPYNSSGSTPVCCPSGTTATCFVDSGTGKNHGIYQNSPSANCCTAWEGPNNYGGPQCTIYCQ